MKAKIIQCVELPTPGKEIHIRILMLNNLFCFVFCIFVNAFIVSCTCLYLSHLCTHKPTTTTTLCVFIRLFFVLFVSYCFRVSRNHCFSATKDQAKEKKQMNHRTSWKWHEALQLCTVFIYFKISYCAHCFSCKVCKYSRQLTTPVQKSTRKNIYISRPNYLFF